MRAGVTLAQGSLGLSDNVDEVCLEDLLEDDERILEFPDPCCCLFCGQALESTRAAAAHQARFCEKARPKAAMAEELGVAPKRLRRWMNEGRLPVAWAKQLGLADLATGRSQLRLQNDSATWFEPTITLDYGWGKLVGLFAAEGFRTEQSVSFALHREEKHLQRHISRMARSLGVKATIAEKEGNGVIVHVPYQVFSRIIGQFVGGSNARTKHLLPPVYQAPAEFRRGVFDGIIEGDGHWSQEAQRETLSVASLDLAAFVLRFARGLGWEATIRRYENDHAGFWRVRFDPAQKARAITVVSVESTGEVDLVDIAINDAAQLYELYDGTVSHNCRIGMGYHYRARYEFVLFFEKGKRRLADLGTADVLPVPRIRGGYPAEKPSELFEILIRQSSGDGDLVVDPFMGSGSVGVAALKLGRRFVGNDISADSLRLSRERLLGGGGTEGALITRGQHHAAVQQRLALG